VRIGVDWCGLVRIGADWCGLVRIGVDWCGLVRPVTGPSQANTSPHIPMQHILFIQ